MLNTARDSLAELDPETKFTGEKNNSQGEVHGSVFCEKRVVHDPLLQA